MSDQKGVERLTSQYPVLNASLRYNYNFDIDFPTGNEALQEDFQIERFDTSQPSRYDKLRPAQCSCFSDAEGCELMNLVVDGDFTDPLFCDLTVRLTVGTGSVCVWNAISLSDNRRAAGDPSTHRHQPDAERAGNTIA